MKENGYIITECVSLYNQLRLRALENKIQNRVRGPGCRPFAVRAVEGPLEDAQRAAAAKPLQPRLGRVLEVIGALRVGSSPPSLRAL